MENLWKKDYTRAQYVDLFDGIHKDEAFNACFEQLDLTTSKKDNHISTSSWTLGNDFFRGKIWPMAMKCYDKSLCFAEIGSENVALAYSSRSSCFFQMKMYDKALNDIELAKGTNLPNHLALTLEYRKRQCLERMAGNVEPSRFVLKLSYNANKSFPCLANVVKIKYNTEFGRHLVATADIPTGQTILMEEMFIKVRDNRLQYACYNCCNEIGNFIACPECPEVLFCNDDCMNRNQTHKWECGISLARLHNQMKFHIRLILSVIDTFKDADSLMNFVEDVLLEDREKLPSSLHGPTSKYHFFLKLKSSAPCNFDLLLEGFKAYSIAMKIPKVREVFNSEDQRCFLMHLVAQHQLITNTNCTGDDESLSVTNFVSLLNHSCAPNILHNSIGNLRYCETVRPVKAGDQLFISYLGIKKDDSVKQRQAKLKKYWGFDCKCERCEPIVAVHPSYPFYVTDPSFKFVLKNYENGDKYTEVLENCCTFLDKYGQFWSKEVQFISHNYSYILSERAWKTFK